MVFLRSEPDNVKLFVDGLSCGACVGRVSQGLASLPGLQNVSVNLATHRVDFRLTGPTELSDVTRHLETLGYPAREAALRLSVASMSCASCAGRVQAALAQVPGVTEAWVNLAAETAQVRYIQGAVVPETLIEVLKKAGYPASLADGVQRQDAKAVRDAEAAETGRNALVAALLALPVFILEMGAHAIPGFGAFIHQAIGHGTSWALQFVLASLVLFGPGRGFFAKGLPALMRGVPDMNSLVALGTGAAYLFSVVATFLPTLLPPDARAVYFEASVMIVVLILSGRYLEAHAKGRTGAAIEGLLGLQPQTALVVRGAEVLDVPVATLSEGDILRVRPGERIAVDGVVLSGESHVDQSMISGESAPVDVSPGSSVTAGTVNAAGSFDFRATRVGADTTLSRIISMVEEAQGAKLPIQTLVDRITLWFVPVILAIALLTIAVWVVFGPSPSISHALVAGVSVLIIACPCAMGLATPTSIMVGTGRAAQLGVLFRQGDALQQLASVNLVALDKTGTVTEGKPGVTGISLAGGVDRKTALRLAASVEARSEHPISHAIVQEADAEGLTPAEVAQFTAIPGQGVRAVVENRAVAVGSARFMRNERVDIAVLNVPETAPGQALVYMAIDGDAVAAFSVADPIKATSHDAIAEMKALGLGVMLVTGDEDKVARDVARATGIDHVHSALLPDGKVDALRAQQKARHRLAFVGDGINDAPVLVAADVGLAIGTGTDIAIEAADVVLMSGDLRGVATAISLSRRTMRNIRQNLFWAFGYNIALIPVAAGVFYPAFGMMLSPVLAAAAMALSSVFVLSNALRLRYMTY